MGLFCISTYFHFNNMIQIYMPNNDICSSSGKLPVHFKSFIVSMIVLDTLQRRCMSFNDVNGR